MSLSESVNGVHAVDEKHANFECECQNDCVTFQKMGLTGTTNGKTTHQQNQKVAK